TGGNFVAGSSGTLSLAGAYTITGTLSGSGAGAIQFSGNLTTGAAGATLDFSTGVLHWIGGRIDGTAAGLTNAGILTFARGPSGDGLFGVVNNSGTIIQTGTGTVGVDISATVKNLAGGVYDFQGDGTLDTGPNARPATTFNLGTLRKSDGTGTSTVTGGAF